jgi:hypothetical protein
MSSILPHKASRKSEEAPLKTLGIAVGALLLSAGPTAAEMAELRQYKLIEGRRDAFIELFEREFVETQEAAGMRLMGQFRDLDDPSRFTWLRAFPDMTAREQSLAAFYSGPVWRTHRMAANGMMIHSDNVLLLRPAGPGLGLHPAVRSGAASAAAGIVVANIWRLWAEPDPAFAAAFQATVRPELEAAGLPVIGAYLPVRETNTFPALAVREGERVFVWFTRADSAEAFAAAVKRLEARPGWKARVAPLLADQLESAPLVRRLAPKPRSALR